MEVSCGFNRDNMVKIVGKDGTGTGLINGITSGIIKRGLLGNAESVVLNDISTSYTVSYIHSRWIAIVPMISNGRFQSRGVPQFIQAMEHSCQPADDIMDEWRKKILYLLVYIYVYIYIYT